MADYPKSVICVAPFLLRRGKDTQHVSPYPVTVEDGKRVLDTKKTTVFKVVDEDITSDKNAVTKKEVGPLIAYNHVMRYDTDEEKKHADTVLKAFAHQHEAKEIDRLATAQGAQLPPAPPSKPAK